MSAPVSSPQPPIDKTRPHLENLKESKQVKEDDYEIPYLTMQTAEVVEQTPQILKEKLVKILSENKVTKEGVSITTLPLPKIFTTDAQQEAIDGCTVKKCDVKLRLATEAKKLEGTPKTQKIGVYHQLIVDRLNTYLAQGELRGYDDRESNKAAIVEMAKKQEFLKLRYPLASQFIFTEGWKNRKPQANSFLKSETAVIAPERLQPIWRISEVFEFEENSSFLFWDLHVYTNHYFDASFTLFEIIPLGAKSIVVMTDVLEVDELKKSAFIRALFKNKMRDAVSLYQDGFLKRLSAN